MRRVHSRALRSSLLAGIVFIVASVGCAYARVDAPPPVPSGLSAEQARSLNVQRDALIADYQTIAGHVRDHNALCRHVAESDARLTAQCRQSNARIDAEEAAYRGRLSTYQARLQSTQREVQIGSSEVSGNVRLIFPDGTSASGNQLTRTTIPFGTHVRTGFNGQIRMTFVEGTSLTIGPDSDIVLDEYSSVRSTIHVIVGHLRARVVHRMRAFEVRTTGFAGAVRGTDFDVQVDPDGFAARGAGRGAGLGDQPFDCAGPGSDGADQRVGNR
jgi:hypothetical protein